MTDDDHHDEERDPLLVRPYLLGDTGAPAADQSTQTWPSATTREVRSHRALAGADDPTALLPLVPASKRSPARGRRRILVAVAACLAVLLGATVAGFAALRAGGRPSVSAALPDAPVPALSGLVPPSPAAPPAAASSAPTPGKSATRRTARTTTAAGPPASATASSSAVPGTTPATGSATGSGKTTAPPAALAPTAPRVGTIRGQNGLCLDLNGAVAVDFNHIQVFDCNNTAAQSWTLATDGTLRVLDMCALIVGDDSVRVTRCDGRTTAQWRPSGQQLINTSNGKCLTDPSSGTDAGTAVRVTSCDGRANERWSLP